MKLLLTSGGFTNKSIVRALQELVGRPFGELKLVFVPTAANVESGGKEWLIDDLCRTKKLGWREVDIVDISAVGNDMWQERTKDTDVVMVGGGNTWYLMKCFKNSGFPKWLDQRKERLVYVGISAGSIAATSSLELLSLLYGEVEYGSDNRGMGWVDFHVRPHLNSDYFPKIRKPYLEELAKKLKEPVYAISDGRAIKVMDDTVEVVGEGEWVKFN